MSNREEDAYHVTGRGQVRQVFSDIEGAEFYALRMSEASEEVLTIHRAFYNEQTGRMDMKPVRQVKPNEFKLNPALGRQRRAEPPKAPPRRPMTPLETAEQFLGLQGSYSQHDLKTVYRAKAKKAHPDLGGSAELFRRLTEHYELVTKSRGWKL